MAVTFLECATGFSVVFLAAKRGRLKKALNDELSSSSSKVPKSSRSFNQGKGQEITGVSLPADGNIKGWEFGEGVRLACANVGGKFYALQVGRSRFFCCGQTLYNEKISTFLIIFLFYLQGECPRCAFDLFKGDLVVDDPGFEENVLACPTCGTTYSLSSGKAGPPLKRKGLAGFVGNLAKTATAAEANRNAKAFTITRDEQTGQVFCREK
jgi:hypothetical protein